MTPYIEDSGWVEMDSYINTEYFDAHVAEHMRIRRIGKMVCLTGRVVNKVVLASRTTYKIFSKVLPNNFLPIQWFSFQGEVGLGLITNFILTTDGWLNTRCREQAYPVDTGATLSIHCVYFTS